MKYSEGGHVGTTELEAMAAVARAAKKRSLEEFEATVQCLPRISLPWVLTPPLLLLLFPG
jgi:hypothetical protein